MPKDFSGVQGPSGKEPESGEVRKVFQGIAPIYDLGNRLMTMGLWSLWLKAFRRQFGVRPGGRYLDVGCGTGDLTLELAQAVGPAGRVVGIDLSPAMLSEARKKAGRAGLLERVSFREGDALRLPFPAESFDGVVSAFVLRSLPERPEAVREMERVVKVGGTMGIMELSRPSPEVLEALLTWYLTAVVPFVGQIVSGRGRAYSWLGDSYRRFPDAPVLATMLERHDWKEIHILHLGLGAVAIHLGRKGLRERKSNGTPTTTSRLGSHEGLQPLVRPLSGGSPAGTTPGGVKHR